MGVLTRAMKAKREREFEQRGVALKIDVLCTPGIVTQIASKLPPTDKSLKGLFRLINSEQYRHELQPFAENYIQIKATEKRLAQERRETKRLEARMRRMRPILERDILNMVDVVGYCEGHDHKFVALNGLFHYLVDNLDILKVLGKRLGGCVRLKFVEVISDLERLEMFEERDQMVAHRVALQDYVRWAVGAL
jgi:hypothetical protein